MMMVMLLLMLLLMVMMKMTTLMMMIMVMMMMMMMMVTFALKTYIFHRHVFRVDSIPARGSASYGKGGGQHSGGAPEDEEFPGPGVLYAAAAARSAAGGLATAG